MTYSKHLRKSYHFSLVVLFLQCFFFLNSKPVSVAFTSFPVHTVFHTAVLFPKCPGSLTESLRRECIRSDIESKYRTKRRRPIINPVESLKQRFRFLSDRSKLITSAIKEVRGGGESNDGNNPVNKSISAIGNLRNNPIFIPEGMAFPLNGFNLPSKYLQEEELESVVLTEGFIEDRVEKMAKELLNDIVMEHKNLIKTKKAKDGDVIRISCICVLKGSIVYFQRLVSHLQYQIRSQQLPIVVDMEYIKVRSYDGMASTGEVNIVNLPDPTTLANSHVVLVEDIIDTGNTLDKLVPTLLQQVKGNSAAKIYNNGKDVDVEGEDEQEEVDHHGPIAEKKPFFDQSTVLSFRIASLLIKRIPRKNDLLKNINTYLGFSVPNIFLIGYGMDFDEKYRDLNHMCLLTNETIKKLFGKK